MKTAYPQVKAAPSAGKAASTQIEDHYAVLTEHTDAAKAIVDSAHVLAMADVQSLVSLRSDTLPDLLLHALSLIDDAQNRADVMREIAIGALKDAGGSQ